MPKRILKLGDLRRTNHLSQNKKLIIFDLDGTLTKSKLPIDKKTAKLLAQLLSKFRVAVIGGGGFSQFQKQFLDSLAIPKDLLKRLFLFPTNSTVFYRYRNGWRKVYEDKLKHAEKKKIFQAFKKALAEAGYRKPRKTYGQNLEDRETQITFSALGQKAPLELKMRWNKKQDIRSSIMTRLKKYLSQFEIRSGGLTSIDITKKGLDKAYGVRQIEKHLGMRPAQILFVGDALYPGGNDYAAVKAGVDCFQVAGPEETEILIGFLVRS